MEKKKNKGKGKTDEGREICMTQKALAEEEAAQRKQVMLTQFLKDKLQKEEQNSVTNQHTLTVKWRGLFRKDCANELRHDIAVLSHTFQRVMGHKDSIIRCLLGNLKESKQQTSHALSSYMQCMEQLLDHQKDSVLSLGRLWSSMVEEISQDFSAERQLLLSEHEKDCKDLEEVNFAIDQYHSEVDSDVRQDFLSTCMDIENRNTEDRNTLRVQLEADVEHLWKEVQRTIWSYNESTEDQYVALDSLQAHDKLCVDEIELHVKKLHKMQESIGALRGRLSCMKRECSGLEGLRALKDALTMEGQQLKAQIRATCSRDKTRLTNLVKHCSETSKKLKAVILKGEKLLRLMRLCQRLEMEREKVHYCPSQSAQEQVLLNTLCMEPMSEEMVKNIQEVAPLENVWHRYNVVLKECLCLKQEKARLSQESRHLHAQYRNFLEDNSVSHEALQQSNPLLMVTKLPLLGRPATAPGARRSVAQLQGAGAAADAGDRTHCIVGRHGRTRHASPMSRAL